MSKLTLDISAMHDDFFAESALIGIAAALPAYRFCWLLNKEFGTAFVREPELDIPLQKTPDTSIFFPVYQYRIPLSEARYLLYRLKNDKDTLLPEVKQLDYLWLLQGDTTDVSSIIQHLRKVPDVQLAQLLSADKLKSIANLLV
jgi:hypothetical protein